MASSGRPPNPATRSRSSGGLARTRLVAKVASDQAKPRGLLWVPSGMEEIFLAPLSVRRIPGIGKVTEAALRATGIETVGQLATATQDKLEQDFGRWGTALYRKARGGDTYEFFVDAGCPSLWTAYLETPLQRIEHAAYRQQLAALADGALPARSAVDGLAIASSIQGGRVA